MMGMVVNGGVRGEKATLSVKKRFQQGAYPVPTFKRGIRNTGTNALLYGNFKRSGFLLWRSLS